MCNAEVDVATIEGITKRVRPGIGRCQGGFCMPLVTKLIGEFLQVPVERVRKAGEGSGILFGDTKCTDEEVAE